MDNLKNTLEFHFYNGSIMAFDLTKMNVDNYDKVAEAIINILARKLQFSDCKFSKYVKKSNILPSCKFDLKMFIQGCLVNTCLKITDVDPAALKNLDALTETLYIMFFNIVDMDSNEIELLSFTSELNLN